jgi:hypothetical protein
MGADVHLATDRNGRYFRAADTVADAGTASVAFHRVPNMPGSVGLFVSTIDGGVRVDVLVWGDDHLTVRSIQQGLEAALVPWTALHAGALAGGNPTIVLCASVPRPHWQGGRHEHHNRCG